MHGKIIVIFFAYAKEEDYVALAYSPTVGEKLDILFIIRNLHMKDIVQMQVTNKYWE